MYITVNEWDSMTEKQQEEYIINNNINTSYSTDISGALTRGFGYLDDNGFWEYTCKKVSENNMLQEIYNSEYAIKNYIKDLTTLHEICNFRYDRGYYKNERMKEIKILDGFIWLDTCGNAMVKVSRDTYSPICFPNKNDICPVCGKGWSIYNIEDYITKYDYSNEERHFYHKQCNFINNINIKQKQFTEIFDVVYSKDYSLKIIPNEYCQCDTCSSWFIFTVYHGDIKIGWRKRVINIEWLDNYKQFSEKFESEDVTREFGKWSDKRYIHAWTIEKAIEYISKAKESIVK